MARDFDALNTALIEGDRSRQALDARLGQIAESLDSLTRKVADDATTAAALSRIADMPGLSRNTSEMVTRILAGLDQGR